MRERSDPNWHGIHWDGTGIVSRGMHLSAAQTLALLDAFREAVAAEREACAKMAESAASHAHIETDAETVLTVLADTIRNRT